MENNFKYLAASEEDMKCGLYLNVDGTTSIVSGSVYPPIVHSSGYYFKWQQGCVPCEYPKNYIAVGTGIFENAYGKFNVKAGSIFFNFPGVWHSYRPETKTGRTE